MKDTASQEEFNPLPEGWSKVRLRDICSPDKVIVEPNSSNAIELPYLGLEHIKSESGQILINPSAFDADEGKSMTFYFDERHVLYGKLRPYLNKVALPDFKGRCTTEIIPLLANEKTTRGYVALLLRRAETVNAVMKETTGSRMPRADMDVLLNLEVPLPPTIEDQLRIASILDKQMEAVAQARLAIEEQLEAAKQLQKAFFRAVFEGEPHRDWKNIRIGDLAKTCSGSTPSRGNPDYYKGSIPWVKTGELKDGLISDSEEKVSEVALRECSIKLLPPETLLVAMYGQGQTRGRTGLLTITATTNQACFAILPNDSFDPNLLQYWFRYNYTRIREESEGRGGNQSNLNGNVLNSQVVSLPSSVSEQKALTRKLSEQMRAVDVLNGNLRAELDALNRLPSALLNGLFAGEL